MAARLVTRALARRLAPRGVGYGQLPVLGCLWDEDGLTQKELSRRVRIEAPTMVRTLDRMERDGFVMRVRSEADRRQIHIMLTDKGRGLQRSMANILAAVDDAALGGISKKDQRQLAELITRVIANLEPQISDRD